MKQFRYIAIGLFFGVIMFKSQAASWFRIYEMFRFESFHMYGIIGSALVLGVALVQGIKYFQVKSRKGNEINFAPKNKSVPRYLFGGIIFGLGWGLAGACPGPMYVLIGAQVWPIVIVLFASILGTLAYGILKDKLPH